MIKNIGGLFIAFILGNIAYSYEAPQETTEYQLNRKVISNTEIVDDKNKIAVKFDKIFEEKFPPNKPGASVLISNGGTVILKKGYGLADIEHGLAIKPHMNFRLGSITKQFTAVAILMLERDGLLKVTDNINLHLPDYPTYGEVITIEDLLWHTSGIFNMTSIPDFGKVISQVDMNTDEIIALFKDLPLNFNPRSKMSYSNSGYILLGAIIEKLSKKSYATFIKERIFDPLGMENSHYGSFTNIIPFRVKGYNLTDGGIVNAPYLSMSIPFSAGSLISNTEDLLKWHKALVAGQVLPLDILNKAWRPVTLTNGENSNYGYGWEVNNSVESKMIFHGGRINGFSTFGVSIVEEDIYVIVLSNLPEAVDIGKLAEQAALDLLSTN